MYSERGGVRGSGGGRAGLARVVPGVLLPQPLDDQRQHVLAQGCHCDPGRGEGRGAVVQPGEGDRRIPVHHHALHGHARPGREGLREGELRHLRRLCGDDTVLTLRVLLLPVTCAVSAGVCAQRRRHGAQV